MWKGKKKGKWSVEEGGERGKLAKNKRKSVAVLSLCLSLSRPLPPIPKFGVNKSVKVSPVPPLLTPAPVSEAGAGGGGPLYNGGKQTKKV